MLKIPAPRGIYKLDFASCSDTDRGLYEAMFQGYLSITKENFSVCILKGTWTQVGNNLQLRVGSFMNHPYKPDKDKYDDATFLSGLTMAILPNHDLTLRPAKGMVMKSSLTFHREPDMKLTDALQTSWSAMDVEDLKAELEFTLGSKLSDHLYEMASTLKSELLDVVESNSALPIKIEAAFVLSGQRGDDLVRRTGNLLLGFTPSKVKDERLFQVALARTLSESHHPSSFYYASQANKRGIMRNYEFQETLANCGNPEAVPILFELARKAKSEGIPRLLQCMRKVSGKNALVLANLVADNPDEKVKFQVLLTRAECETTDTKRNQAVKALVSQFDKFDWLQQCDAAQALGVAQTKLAHSSLKKISSRGKHDAVQRWIDGALEKYKKGNRS